MSIITFIGRRFITVGKGAFSTTAIRISLAGIALSVIVMVMSVVIVKGFQKEIRDKVTGFEGHVVVRLLQVLDNDIQMPLEFDRADIQHLADVLPDIVSIDPIAEKAGIIKTKDQIEGCVFRGVSYSYSRAFIKNHIVEGRFPDISEKDVSQEICISTFIANRLGFKTGDDIRMYFLLSGEQQPRGRKFKISGLFQTGMSEFDARYAFGDIRHIQQLHNWKMNQAGEVEIVLKSGSDIEDATSAVQANTGYDLEVMSVRDQYPEIFNWLDLLDMNVSVIITIMMIVAVVNIITILLIRILEKTTSIGILKSLGTTDRSIRRIFQFVSVSLLFRGLLIGNVVGLGLAWLQKRFEIIGLNQETYFVSVVPVHFDAPMLIFINLLLFFTGVIVMVFPSYIVARIFPASTLRLK